MNKKTIDRILDLAGQKQLNEFIVMPTDDDEIMDFLKKIEDRKVRNQYIKLAIGTAKNLGNTALIKRIEDTFKYTY